MRMSHARVNSNKLKPASHRNTGDRRDNWLGHLFDKAHCAGEAAGSVGRILGPLLSGTLEPFTHANECRHGVVPHEIPRCTSGHHNDAHRLVAGKSSHHFQEGVTHFRIEKDTGWTPQGYEGHTVLGPYRKNLRTNHH